ncbi:MAG: hypothetical protein WCO30_02265, partial [bacterium]
MNNMSGMPSDMPAVPSIEEKGKEAFYESVDYENMWNNTLEIKNDLRGLKILMGTHGANSRDGASGAGWWAFDVRHGMYDQKILNAPNPKLEYKEYNKNLGDGYSEGTSLWITT